MRKITLVDISLHLAIDNLQRKNPLSCFFTYRVLKRFDADIIVPEHKEALGLESKNAIAKL